ncbi:hypothetical protein [Lysinibacillus yapensis]|uniref:hypothetical protein n=1 Tax=Ureibacillus yapensis TaxID=2304605 RepID=UPI0011C402BA|nr:hypothetical protein [Lysinibacillus yapensis]
MNLSYLKWMLEHSFPIILLGQKVGIFTTENTLLQEKMLISVVKPIMVKEISTILPIEEAAVTLSKFTL